MEQVARTAHQLGQLLKTRRKKLKLTQAELAQRMGIRQSQISVIEAQDARATVMTLYKALSALGLEMVLREKSAPASSEW